MKISSYYLLLILVVLAQLQACTEDTNDKLPKLGKLGGQVTDNVGKPLEDVNIKISSSNLSGEQQTNEYGRYIFGDLPIGDYKVEVSKANYIGKAEVVTLKPNIVNEADFMLEGGKEILTISDSVIHVGVNSGQYEITVQSNTTWTIVSDSEWATLTTTSGNGDGKILVSWSENAGDSTKTATITLNSGNLTKSLKVVQASAIKVSVTKGIVGNQLTPDFPSKVIITFSRPISAVQRIDPLFMNCQGAPFSPTLNSDRTQISFTYSCARLGRKYPFTIEFLDTENNSHIVNFEVEFYDKKLQINGMIGSSFSVPNEDRLWIITTAPSKVYKIDLSTFEIEKEFDFRSTGNFPHEVVINPYNNLLYISSLGKLDLYSQETGKLVKSVKLPKPEHDSYADHYVFSMAFNKTGMGIISLRQSGSSGENWLIIDSANDHLITTPREFGYDNGQFHQVYSLTSSNDQKKLKFVVPNGTERGFYESNEELSKFTKLHSFIEDAGYNKAIYSKIDDRAILDLQYISLIEGDNIHKLGNLGYSNISFDFLYNTTKPLMYCSVIEKGVFFIYNYENKEIIQQYASENWSHIYGTIDGKNLIVHPSNMDYNESTHTFESSLLLFQAETFYE